MPDEGKRFENYIAVEMKILTDLWTDDGLGEFELRYIRDRDGKETDFIVLRDEKPWLLIECKISRNPIEFHHKKIKQLLGKDVPLVQIVRETRVAENPEAGIYQISASRFLG